MATIFIEQLAVNTTIGVLAWERQLKQTLLLDIELEYDISQASQSDKLEHTIDYTAITTMIIDFSTHASFQLLEAFGHSLLEKIHKEFSITWIRLRLTKHFAANHAKAVGVIMERGERS